MKETFAPCTFCHRQALIADTFRAENAELKHRVAVLEDELRKAKKQKPQGQEAA